MSGRFEILKRNMRSAMVFVTCMVAFTVIAMSAGESDTYAEWLGRGLTTASAETVGSENPAAAHSQPLHPRKKSAQTDRGEFFREMQSGIRFPEDIDFEIRQVTGDSKGIEFDRQYINRAYKLSYVMARYQNISNNPYDILYVNTAGEMSGIEEPVTLYTRTINGLEEQNTRGQISFSRMIEIGDDGQPLFTPALRMNFEFSLHPNSIKRNFDLREPDGRQKVTVADEGSFDPLSILTDKDRPFDRGLYTHDILRNGKINEVKVTVRPTEMDTMTFEVRIQELGSKIVQTYILVYEEL